jgi:hypothetical protein
MSLSNSLLSYSDCIALYDAALADPLGARLDFTSHGAASYFVARLHQCRVLDRKKNAETYRPGDRFFNRSVYDALVCRIKEGTIGSAPVWWVYIEHSAVKIEGFQRLSEVEDEALVIEAQPPRLLLPAPQAQGIKRRV